jgi:RhtB (resistance to homoserine/threonine) family protein
MEYLGLIGSVTLIHLLAVMSPGPDFLIVMKHSIGYNRRVAIWTAIGIGTGIMVHVMYSFVGLALLISKSPVLFNIIKYAGAIYLLYLGLSSLRQGAGTLGKVNKLASSSIPSDLKSFRIGFLTNVLNPKATLFFLSLFTLVIDQSTPNSIMVLISAIMVINTTLWFVLLAYLITIDKIRLRFNSYEKWFNMGFGILLIIVSLQIALG